MTTDEILKVLNVRFDDMDRDRLVIGQAYTEGYLDALMFIEAMLMEEYGQGWGPYRSVG